MGMPPSLVTTLANVPFPPTRHHTMATIPNTTQVSTDPL